MAATYGEIGEQLRDLVNSAPPEINDSTIDLASKTARYCRIVDREQLGHDQFLPTVEEAVKNAEALCEAAERSEEDVGLF